MIGTYMTTEVLASIWQRTPSHAVEQELATRGWFSSKRPACANCHREIEKCPSWCCMGHIHKNAGHQCPRSSDQAPFTFAAAILA